ARVDVLRDLVALDVVRNDRRLPWVAARNRTVVLLHPVGVGRVQIGNRRCAADRRDLVLRQGRPRERERNRRDERLHTFTIRTAHFLKSVWREIGQVASSVSLLTSRPSSKNGT